MVLLETEVYNTVVRSLVNFYVKRSSNGIDYPDIVIDEGRTFKLIWIKVLITHTIYIVLIRLYHIINVFLCEKFFEWSRVSGYCNCRRQNFQTDMDKSACYTYNLHSVNRILPYCQCKDCQRFQLPCKHTKTVFRNHSFIWENLQQCCNSLPSFVIHDNLLPPKKYIHSVEETQIAEVTNENRNQGMSDDSITS